MVKLWAVTTKLLSLYLKFCLLNQGWDSKYIVLQTSENKRKMGNSVTKYLFLPELISVLMSSKTYSKNVCKVVKVNPRGPHDEEPEVVLTNIISQGTMVGSSVPAH